MSTCLLSYKDKENLVVTVYLIIRCEYTVVILNMIICSSIIQPRTLLMETKNVWYKFRAFDWQIDHLFSSSIYNSLVVSVRGQVYITFVDFYADSIKISVLNTQQFTRYRILWKTLHSPLIAWKSNIIWMERNVHARNRCILHAYSILKKIVSVRQYMILIHISKQSNKCELESVCVCVSIAYSAKFMYLIKYMYCILTTKCQLDIQSGSKWCSTLTFSFIYPVE